MVNRRAGDSHDSVAMPSYSEVFRTRGYLAIFLAAALSTWGDYLARLTVAAFVFEQTGSPFAAAATFAVSLLPTIFGRSLLAPIADRIPYKYVLIASHLTRAVLVGGLIIAVGSRGSDVSSLPTDAPAVALWVLFTLLFLVELAGGPAIASGQILMTDLFIDRRLYARALGLSTMSEHVNQAIGLGLGGVVVAWVGTGGALWFDLATFLVSAVVIAYAAAKDPSGSARLGGLLMAAPILGAVAGLVMVGRWQPERQNPRIIVMALLMPLPLVVTVIAPPVLIAWLLWFGCGVLQAFMLPLQSTFSLVIPVQMRGRVFGLAGALSVAATGVAFLVAGWLAELTSPAWAVAICALASLLAIVVVAVRWPRAALRAAVDTAYNS